MCPPPPLCITINTEAVGGRGLFHPPVKVPINWDWLLFFSVDAAGGQVVLVCMLAGIVAEVCPH